MTPGKRTKLGRLDGILKNFGTSRFGGGNTEQKYAGRLRHMNPLTTLTDGGLSLKARKGDREAFAELFRRHNRPIYRFALQMSGKPEVADEVTQDVFLALLRDTLAFDETRGSFEAFLFGVARNMVRRYLRVRPMDDVAGFEEHPGFDPDIVSDLTRRENLDRLRQAVLSLPENYREVVVLCELEEMSYEQTAAVLGCPLGTVRSRLSRARDLLASKLTSKKSLAAQGQKELV